MHAFNSKDHRAKFRCVRLITVPDIQDYVSLIFIVCQHTDIVCPSVRYIPVFYGNGLTYCHSFFTTW